MSISPNDTTIPIRRCRKCDREFPLTEEYWYRHKSCRGGFVSTCKICASNYMRERYIQNSEMLKARSRESYNKDPERVKDRIASWRAKNPDKVNEAARNRYKKNPDPIRRRLNQWKKENPESVNASTHRRKARKRSLPNTLTEQDIQHALDYFGNCCAVCGRQLNGFWHTGALDHWIPLNSPDCPGSIPTNELPLCHGLDGCNNKKGDRDPVEWLISRYGKRKASIILTQINVYFASLKQEAE